VDAIRGFFARLADGVQQMAEQWGAAGLAAVAFVDSSFLTLPEVADILVIMFTIKNPDLWWWYGLATTAGSIAGCLALYFVARTGGHALVRRGIHERHIDRVMEWFRKYGAPVLLLPSMLPPPMPFKLFVLMAGLSDLRVTSFALAIAVGRGVRYVGEAWLARQYGEAAITYLERNAFDLVVPIVGILIVAAAIWWMYARWRRKQT
jgi:membrane protein YqaA with SNARE-associated domain